MGSHRTRYQSSDCAMCVRNGVLFRHFPHVTQTRILFSLDIAEQLKFVSELAVTPADCWWASRTGAASSVADLECARLQLALGSSVDVCSHPCITCICLSRDAQVNDQCRVSTRALFNNSQTVTRSSASDTAVSADRV